jgi:hypothetical protein
MLVILVFQKESFLDVALNYKIKCKNYCWHKGIIIAVGARLVNSLAGCKRGRAQKHVYFCYKHHLIDENHHTTIINEQLPALIFSLNDLRKVLQNRFLQVNLQWRCLF